MCCPFDFVVDPQAFEEFFVAGKDLFEGGDQQGFAESSGTGDKVVFSAIGKQIVNIFGFVYLKIIFSADMTKGLNPKRQFFHGSIVTSKNHIDKFILGKPGAISLETIVTGKQIDPASRRLSTRDWEVDLRLVSLKAP
jgi:hypothetical protein